MLRTKQQKEGKDKGQQHQQHEAEKHGHVPKNCDQRPDMKGLAPSHTLRNS